MGRKEPQDLSGACKFATLFAQELFGGNITGNWHHIFLMNKGKKIDLIDGVGVPIKYKKLNDPVFLKSAEFKKSLSFCYPRVKKWVIEFISGYVWLL